jgi:hypothetical protein
MSRFTTRLMCAGRFFGPRGRISAWVAAALIVTFITSHAAGQADKNPLFLKPTRVDADKAFDLEVLSLRWSCGAAYSHITSARSGDRLNVRFLATENPQAVCPGVVQAYGPKVPVAALPAGRYDVHATLLLPCHVLPMPCDAPEQHERVGFLDVGKQAEADWFARPIAAAAGKPFELRILSDKYGNCHTSFDHKTLEIKDGRLVAAFVIKTDTTLICAMDLRPHGPAFQVEALPAGKYPVDVIETPACVYQTPACPWLPPEKTARTVDTLMVSGPTAVNAPAKGSAARGGARIVRGLVKGDGTRSKNVQGRTLAEEKP